MRKFCLSLALTITVFLIRSKEASGYLTVRPNSTVVLVGGSFELLCKTNLTNASVFWQFKPLNGSENITIFNQSAIPPLRRSYSINRTEAGQYDLIGNTSEFSMAGIYQCSEESGDFATCSVTIYDKPSFNLSTAAAVENDTISATCRANYRGTSNSSVNLMLSKPMKNPPIRNDLSVINQTVLITFSFPATADLDGANISCSVASFNATQSYQLNISYPVRDIVITPQKEIYKPGEILTCSAHGNPPANYSWKANKTGIETPGPDLLIESNMTSKNLTYVCTAANVVFERLHSAVAVINFEVLPDSMPVRNLKFVQWWQWYQAVDAIVTVDIVALFCFIGMVVISVLDSDSKITFSSRCLMTALNISICMILSTMIWIGCAIRLAKDTVCPSQCTMCNCNASGVSGVAVAVYEGCTFATAVQWETGVIVMFGVLFLLGFGPAAMAFLSKCTGSVYLIVLLVWDVITLLVAIGTLAWTLTFMRNCREPSPSSNSSEWSWEIFLITFAVSFVLLVIPAFWYLYRKRHFCYLVSNTHTEMRDRNGRTTSA